MFGHSADHNMEYSGGDKTKRNVRTSVMSKNNSWTTEMIACLWIILTLSSVAVSQPNFYTHGRYGKRQEAHTSLDPSTFFSGSRYGRRDSRIKDTNSHGKTIELLPRSDRFFLGSRYGKRGEFANMSDKRFVSLKNIEEVLKYYDRVKPINQKSMNENLNKVAYDVNRVDNESNLLSKSKKILEFPNYNSFRKK